MYSFNLTFLKFFINEINFFIRLGIEYDDCVQILRKFAQHANKSDGKMNLKNFSNYLGLPAYGAVIELFNIYDKVC